MVTWLAQISGPSRTAQMAAWLLTVTVIALLGLIRTSTDAEFAFASLVIVPILLVAWFGGLGQGAVASLLGAGLWVITDFGSALQVGREWVPVVNGLTRLATYLLVAYLASAVRNLVAREAERATRDPLTGLLNHHAFHDVGAAEVRRAGRYGHHLAVAFIDLDDFKVLNDTRGHRTGDDALVAAARALRRAVRDSDVVARLGGDEFALLFPELSREAASAAAHRLGVALEGALAEYSPVSASIGVAWFEDATTGFAELVNRADELMYEAKREGKGVVFAHDFPSQRPCFPEEGRSQGDGARNRAGGRSP